MMEPFARAARDISCGLSDLEDIAFRVVAIADLGAFEFPFALGGIHGAAPLGRSRASVGDIVDREHELDRRVLAPLRRRRNVDRVGNALRNPDDDEPRWRAAEDGKSL